MRVCASKQARTQPTPDRLCTVIIPNIWVLDAEEPPLKLELLTADYKTASMKPLAGVSLAL